MFFLKRRKTKTFFTTVPEAEAILPRSELFSSDPKLRQQQNKLDIRSLLGQGAGLRYLARLIALSGALAGSYSPSGAHATAYNEGLRRLGLFILTDVQKNAPELLPKLLQLCLPGSSPVQPESEQDRPLQ